MTAVLALPDRLAAAIIRLLLMLQEHLATQHNNAPAGWRERCWCWCCVRCDALIWWAGFNMRDYNRGKYAR